MRTLKVPSITGLNDPRPWEAIWVWPWPWVASVDTRPKVLATRTETFSPRHMQISSRQRVRAVRVRAAVMSSYASRVMACLARRTSSRLLSRPSVIQRMMASRLSCKSRQHLQPKEPWHAAGGRRLTLNYYHRRTVQFDSNCLLKQTNKTTSESKS